jgi:hypothetical protein
MNVNNNNAGRGNVRQGNNNAQPPRIIHQIPVEIETDQETPEALIIRNQATSLSNQRITIVHQERQIHTLNAHLNRANQNLTKLAPFADRGELQYMITEAIEEHINVPPTRGLIINALEASGTAGSEITNIIFDHNNTPQDPLSSKIQTYLTKHVTEANLELIQDNISNALCVDNPPPH